MANPRQSERDPLLHEVATMLRDVGVLIARYERGGALDADDPLVRASDDIEDLLGRVVAREGDIIPTPPGGPERWADE